MAFIDSTSLIGGLFQTLTTDVTGSIFLSLLLLSAIFLAVCMGFGLPLEVAIPLVFPFFLAAIFISGQFLPVLGAAIILMGIVLTKRFWLF